MAKKSFGTKDNSFMSKMLKDSALNASLKEHGKMNVFGKIQVHPDLQQYIAPLSQEELGILERSILKERKVRDSLLLWRFSEDCYYILDGHHRYSILADNQKKEIDWSYQLILLDSIDAAFELMEEIQLGRRNATKSYVSYLRGRAYLREKGKHGGDHISEQGKNGKSVEIVAERFKVGRSTIIRDSYFSIGLDRFKMEPYGELRNRLLAGEGVLTKSEVSFLGQYDFLEVEDFMKFKAEGGSIDAFNNTPQEHWVSIMAGKPKEEEAVVKTVKTARKDQFFSWISMEQKTIDRLVKKGSKEDLEKKRVELEGKVKELQGMIQVIRD